MQVEFFSPYPYDRLEPALESMIQGARRVDAAIAFVTGPGVALIRQYVKSHGPGNARLAASVRFPTNLVELANLEEDFPGTVFIHTGFQTPIEKGADRGQFHSKVVLLELDGTERCIVLGSHNWTGNALHGHNMEAGVILRCQESDPIVAQVRQHIEACARRSEPFACQRLRFYQAIQRDLHRRIRPGGTDSEDFPGFEPMDALVMHAEDATGSGVPRPLQLFLPVRDSHTRDFFPDGRRVLLYVYPAGCLLGQSPPTAPPLAYEGGVTMTNVVRDASAQGRPATCQIADLTRPRIELLPGGTVPAPGGEISQVVIRFNEQGEVELPIFHAAAQHPKMKLGVEYEVIDRDEADKGAVLKQEHSEEGDAPHREDSPPLPEYRAPRHLTLEAEIKVPSRGLYRSEIEQVLKRVVYSSDMFDETTVPDLTVTEPTQAKVLSPFVYQVNYWLSKETMARVEKQLRLFPAK
ncbi:MAG: hypothetical protein ABIK89_26675 [Planctomycetota bacterium]